MKIPLFITSSKQVIANAKKIFKFSWKMNPKLTFWYFGTAFIQSWVPLLASVAGKLMIDNLQVFQDSKDNPEFVIPFVIICILALRYLISFIESIVYWGINQSYLDFLYRNELQNTIALRFHTKISGIDIAYFEDPNVQDLISKTRDTMKWRIPDYLRICSYLLTDIVVFTLAFFALLPYGLWMPILIFVVSIPRLILQAKYSTISWSIWGSGAPEAKKLWYLDHLLQDPMTVREMRISRSAGKLLKKFKGIQDHLYGLLKISLKKYLNVLIFPPIIESIVIFIIAYQFLPSVFGGILSIGTYILIINMLEQLGMRASNASAHLGTIYENNLYLNHYFELLALPKIIKDSKNPVSFEKIEPPYIEFRNVSFNYPNGGKVLENISFIINPGESVAFVGKNGAGKSTIIKLICRFYDVSDGEILINGVNLKELKLDNWYQFIGTLFQEFIRYHFMVKENITFGSPQDKDESAMYEAATKAGASEFIEKLPKKYEQVLGTEFENGEDLSGGQWQKLAIARAFYEEPPVLILDEPTSSIDAEAEYEIFNNLGKQYKNKTLIMVSHRFSTVRNANKIIVINEGKIVEMGTHEELLSIGGYYAKLFSIQARGYQ
jgi:ABC-type multidrug transport system fused ATPase/permease subunit